MFNEIIEFSTQPYMVFWTCVFGIMALLTICSLVFGDFLEIDFDADADMDLSLDGAGHGFLGSIMSFMDIGHVPITFLLFIFSSLNWGIGITINSYINTGHSTVFGLILLVPVLIGSFFITKIINIPVKKLYKAMNGDHEIKNHAIGSICITTTDVNEQFGQAQVKTTTSPINLMVLCDKGKNIPKGNEAIVLSFDDKTNRYLISEINESELLK